MRDIDITIKSCEDVRNEAGNPHDLRLIDVAEGARLNTSTQVFPSGAALQHRMRLAAPLLGVLAGGRAPLTLTVAILIAVFISSACPTRLLALPLPASAYVRSAGIAGGHLVHAFAVLCLWNVLSQPGPADVSHLLLSLTMISISFSAWLAAPHLRGTPAVVVCWVSFTSIAIAMVSLR
jgi:hypothetical protein